MVAKFLAAIFLTGTALVSVGAYQAYQKLHPQKLQPTATSNNVGKSCSSCCSNLSCPALETGTPEILPMPREFAGEPQAVPRVVPTAAEKSEG